MHKKIDKKKIFPNNLLGKCGKKMRKLAGRLWVDTYSKGDPTRRGERENMTLAVRVPRLLELVAEEEKIICWKKIRVSLRVEIISESVIPKNY